MFHIHYFIEICVFLIGLSSITTPLHQSFFVMSILVCVRYMEIYYFILGANYMLTLFYIPDFLLYTVTSMCMYIVDIFRIQLVFFPSWIYGMYEE